MGTGKIPLSVSLFLLCLCLPLSVCLSLSLSLCHEWLPTSQFVCFQTGNYTTKDKPFPRGEILLGGGNIVQGYYKMPEKTKEDFTTIDGVRYFMTGDIGQFEADGCLRVIGKIVYSTLFQETNFRLVQI